MSVTRTKNQKARLGRATVKAIKDVATSIDRRIGRMRKPEVTFPVRSLGNVRYDPRKGYFEIGRDKSTRTLSVNTAKSFAQTLKMMSLSKELVETALIAPLKVLIGDGVIILFTLAVLADLGFYAYFVFAMARKGYNSLR